MINYPTIDDIVSDHENDIIDESSKSIKGQETTEKQDRRYYDPKACNG